VEDAVILDQIMKEREGFKKAIQKKVDTPEAFSTLVDDIKKKVPFYTRLL